MTTNSHREDLGARCWAMTTGETGMRHQAIGLAGMIDSRFEERTVRLSHVLAAIPPHWLFSQRGRAGGSGAWSRALLRSAGLSPPWPEVLITCGRRSVAYALAIRQESGGRTMTIHIQNPRVPPACFDLVVMPAHDASGVSGTENVLLMTGAMHHLGTGTVWSQRGKEALPWRDLPRPWFGVLLGGKSRAYDMTPADLDMMARQLQASLEIAGGGSVLLIPSRRTSPSCPEELRKRLANLPFYLWGGEEPNPYRAALARSDFLCVTRDSVSMLSEACFTGLPVYLLRVSGHSDRMAAFHARLLSNHHARWLDAFDPNWEPQRLDEITAIVSEISRRIESRRVQQGVRHQYGTAVAR